jgi:dienelactone hydrolase
MMSALAPSSCTLGPHAAGTQNARHLCNKSFTSATIYYPTTDGLQLLPSIVIVGGWGCGEQAMAAWAPFYASHGIVAMTIGTPSPWKDAPAARCQALLDASLALQTEHERTGSVLQGRLDVSRRAVQGYSLGGGGAQLAALTDQNLKCVIAICPDDGKDMMWLSSAAHALSFPSKPSAAVPVLIICGQKDTEAPAKTKAWSHYRQTSAAKLIFEVAGGDHYVGLGPAGGNSSELEAASDSIALCCNCSIAYACVFLCPNALWCAPCPNGTLNGSSGQASDHAPRGAIGGVALAWLRLFLLSDENARSQLVLRPDIASGFECSGVAVPLAMDR